MRVTCLFVVGIAAFACKDKQPAKPSEQKTPSLTATPGSAGAQPQARPAQPTLPPDQSFDAETRDATWAGATEQAIGAVAPQLKDVTCKRMQCRVTLTGASEAELVQATEKLQADDSLRSIDGAQNILLTRPEQQGSAFAMKIYVRFDRD